MRVDRGNGRGDWTAVEDEALMQVREAIGEWLALTSEELDQEGLAEDQPEQQPLVLQSIVAMAIALVVCQLVWGGGDDGIAQAARRIGQDFMEAVRLAADPNNAWI
jgi:small-conductance mechanosensitive channel